MRYLGVILDNKLSFDRHISSVCQKLNKARGALNAISSNLSHESMVTIYYSIAYSHVVQSVIIWGGASNTKINKVRVALNKILRVILGVKTDNFHVQLLGSNEMYVMLELLKFDDILD